MLMEPVDKYWTSEQNSGEGSPIYAQRIGRDCTGSAYSGTYHLIVGDIFCCCDEMLKTGAFFSIIPALQLCLSLPQQSGPYRGPSVIIVTTTVDQATQCHKRKPLAASFSSP